MSKRKKPYEFRYETDEGADARRIFASFNDAYGQTQEVEVSEELHLELTLLNRSIRNLEVSERRHNEFLDLTEDEIAKRGAKTTQSAEDEVMETLLSNELAHALNQIPTNQARRFLLFHLAGFSYAEIAVMEGCSISAVDNSIYAAKKKLRKILRD